MNRDVEICDDLLLDIFEFVGRHALGIRVSLVGRRFNNFAQKIMFPKDHSIEKILICDAGWASKARKSNGILGAVWTSSSRKVCEFYNFSN